MFQISIPQWNSNLTVRLGFNCDSGNCVAIPKCNNPHPLNWSCQRLLKKMKRDEIIVLGCQMQPGDSILENVIAQLGIFFVWQSPWCDEIMSDWKNTTMCNMKREWEWTIFNCLVNIGWSTILNVLIKARLLHRQIPAHYACLLGL